MIGSGAEIYFTGRVENGKVIPVTVDRIDPYFRGAEMALHAIDAATDQRMTRGVKVYRITTAEAELVKG